MDKQIFAKVGVFLLLGANVAGYYYLWPHKDGAGKNEARASAQEVGQTQLLPAKKDDPPVAVIQEVKPLKIADLPSLSENSEDAPLGVKLPSLTRPGPGENQSDDVARLLDHIRKEADTPKPTADEKPPLIVAFPEEKRPDPLPPLPDSLRSNEAKANIAAPIATPTNGPGPWLVHMETIGTQTQLIARLRTHNNAEFRILCDRVEMKAPGGAVQALGNVTFQGAGIQGACQRLSIPLHEAQLIFETGAHLRNDANPASNLRGERILWEPAADTPLRK